MRYEHIMVDIETLGTEPGCALLSIGAVQFDPENGLGQKFYTDIDVTSCQEFGLEVDAETLDWHLTLGTFQGRDLATGQPLDATLLEFNEWLEMNSYTLLWANSPKFDFGILEHTYEELAIDIPWNYHDLRDYRTLSDLPCAVEVERDGEKHNALNDATHQARVAARTIQNSREGNS